MLYAVYSFPNVVIPLLGGALIDRIGARVVFIITCMFCVLGQLVCAVGGFAGWFWLMLIGRAVFGVGGEVLQGSQSTIISNWFKPHELSVTHLLVSSYSVSASASPRWAAR
jgi:MFS family permease